MRSIILLAAASLTVGCTADDPGVRTVDVTGTVQSPSAALADPTESLGYGTTDELCFRAPGQGRGTGYAQAPELALGSVWLQEPFCGDDCAWEPTLDVYVGTARTIPQAGDVLFSGYVRFDGSDAAKALESSAGTTIDTGTLVGLEGVRTWTGSVDYSRADVKMWVADWMTANEDDLETIGTPGLAWNANVFQWDLTLYEQITEDLVEEGDVLVQDGDTLFRATEQGSEAWEVFVCVVPMTVVPLP